MDTDPFDAVIGEFGEILEYQKLGTPAPVGQLAFPDELALKVIVGFLYPGSVTKKFWLVSAIRSVTVPDVDVVTVNVALPFTALVFTDPDWPFIRTLPSLVSWVTAKLSSEARLLWQSLSSMLIVTVPPDWIVCVER